MTKSEFLALIQSAKYDTYKAVQKADKRHDKMLKLLILAYKNLESACDLYSEYVYEKEKTQ